MPKTSALSKYGPWALVTGASSGIGMAFARQLAARGFNLVITARRRARLEQLAGELRYHHGVMVAPLVLDLGDKDYLQQILAACEGRDIGLVVSNAGFGFKGLHQEMHPAALERMLEVNCHVPMQLAYEFLPRLRQRGRGGLIITSSVEAFFGLPGSAGYSASKAFAKSLGEALYGENLGSGVDVLVLCPGLTDTEAPTLQGYDKAQMRGMRLPEAVAAEAIRALGVKPVVVSASWRFRSTMRLLSLLPRKWTLALAARAVPAEQKEQAQQALQKG